MSDYQPIIDVQPVSHSREQATRAANSSSAQRSRQSADWNNSSSFRSPSNAGPIPPFGTAYAQGQAASAASKSDGSVLGGVARIAAGAGLVVIGVPMLILPGPGLLTMAAGALLMASGARRMFG